MHRRKLVWQLYPSYLMITLLALLAVSAYFTQSLRSFYKNEMVANLESRAHLLQKQVEHHLNEEGYGEIDALVKEVGASSHTRITVILPDGRVIADSEKNPSLMDNHRHRPEIQSALDNRLGSSTRYSDTLQKNMLYVAIPLLEGDQVAAVIRTSTPISSIDQTLDEIYSRLGWAGLIITLLTAIVSWFNARRISRPLEEIRNRARRIAAGDLSGRLPLKGSEEVGSVADAMDQMAEQLDHRIRTILRQGNEQEAVFSSMVEGVIAIDSEERVLRLNDAAAHQLGITLSPVRGRILQELIRNSELNKFVSHTLQSEVTTEGQITIFRGNETIILQTHGSALIDENGHRAGAVIVLNDITRLLEMKKAQRDFVANVSHELKTPITAIQGFVETLIDGAKDDPPVMDRFLAIIHAQVDRMNNIIEDLLQLARLERESDVSELVFAVTPLLPILQTAVQTCTPRAETKSIKMEISCENGLAARINPTLLEQAVVNLLDNAVKYSEENTRVLLAVSEKEGEIEIRVSDEGIGIPAEHLPHLFKRFYRVDKSRSRQAGGTGLGLAIVKHIVIAHGGRVDVESTFGKGSGFFIYLPRLTTHS